jgi:hypothetical protein
MSSLVARRIRAASLLVFVLAANPAAIDTSSDDVLPAPRRL